MTAAIKRLKAQMGKPGRYLMVTFGPMGAKYEIMPDGVIVRADVVRPLVDCKRLDMPAIALMPQCDGLFPDTSQTWRLM